MSEAAEPVGSVEVALGHAARLLESSPLLAAEQAGEILKAVPAHPLATLLLGVARRCSGDPAAALEVLGPWRTCIPDGRSPTTNWHWRSEDWSRARPR